MNPLHLIPWVAVIAFAAMLQTQADHNAFSEPFIPSALYVMKVVAAAAVVAILIVHLT